MSNPYAAGSLEATEYGVWDRGRLAGGRERDFLRAFHGKQGVLDLQACIQSATGTQPRVTSLWIDRYPIARPHAPSTPVGRELGDLAVVVRALGPTGLRERMFLAQGKVHHPSWKSMGSSPKEIDFLEKVPVFDLWTSAHPNAAPLGQFDLQSDFGQPPHAGIPFWAYLLFAPSSPTATIGGPSHAYVAWPSQLTTCEPFFSCVVEQTRACMAGSTLNATSNCMPPWGADVGRGTSCTEWRRLYVTLSYHVHRKLASKLTGGPWKNIVPLALPQQAVSLVAAGSGGNLGLMSTGFATQFGSARTSRAKGYDFYRAEIHEWHQFDYHRIKQADPYITDESWDGDDPEWPEDRDAEDDGPGFGMIFVDLAEPLD